MDKLDGGSILPITDFWVGSGLTSHTGDQPGRPISQVDLDATNRLQRTGWRINQDILRVATAAFDSGHPSITVDPHTPPESVGRVGDEEWASWSRDDRTAHLRSYGAARTRREQWRSGVSEVSGLLASAKADEGWGSLYIPYGHDARLRRYPRVTNGPSPQGSDLSRSLLSFDTPVPLGDRGMFWLLARAATCAGLDKISHADRAAWATENMNGIIASAAEPLGCGWWHSDRDDPWGLLAACFDISAAVSSGNPSGWASATPVHVDGTCNGLQHLSALGLDQAGAVATNLTSDPTRHDIYSMVADRVRARVSHEVADGVAVAALWDGRIDRSVVKRAVMTTPYGVTSRGMRTQLVDDGLVPDHDPALDPAGYLRDLMWDAIGDTVLSARRIMGWLQDTAGALAEHQIPFTWMTPTGSMIQQSYRPQTFTTPNTSVGRVRIVGPVDRSSLKKRKQQLGAAPNFVHSFDAAHLALTINSGASRGITHWAAIHDSYGTHAARMDTLNRVLREEFAVTYSGPGGDWIGRTYDLIKGYAPEVAIPEPPPRGDFDVLQVLDSPWFFA